MRNRLPFLVGSSAPTTTIGLEQFHARTFARQDGYTLKETLRPGYAAWVSDSEFNPAQLSAPYDYVLFLEGEHELIEDPADPLKSYVYLEDGYGVIFGAPNFDRRAVGTGYSISFKHQTVLPTAGPITPEDPDEPGLVCVYSPIHIIGQDEMHVLLEVVCRQYADGLAKYNLNVRQKDGSLVESQDIGFFDNTDITAPGSPVDLFVELLDDKVTLRVGAPGDEGITTSITGDFYRDGGDSILELFLPKTPNPGEINLVNHYYDLVIRRIPGAGETPMP